MATNDEPNRKHKNHTQSTEICDWETTCPKSKDGLHCNCWYDGKACCRCGDPATDDSEEDE